MDDASQKAIQGTQDFIDHMRKIFEAAASFLRNGNDHAGLRNLEWAASDFDQFLRLMGSLSRALSIRPLSLQRFERAIHDVSNRIAEALKKRDYPTVCDEIERGMLPQLENWLPVAQDLVRAITATAQPQQEQPPQPRIEVEDLIPIEVATEALRSGKVKPGTTIEQPTGSVLCPQCSATCFYYPDKIPECALCRILIPLPPPGEN